MINDDGASAVRPLTLAWVGRHLNVGERVVRIEALHGGITAEMRRPTIGTRDGEIRYLVLRSFVDPSFVESAEDSLNREAGALTQLMEADVPTPGLVAADPTAVQCEYPSLLMTHLAGRAVLDDEGLERRIPLLTRQLAAIHALRPVERPRKYMTLTTAETVVVPKGADTAAWAAAIEMLRKPVPSYAGRFLHGDFQPGNVLFDVRPDKSACAPVTGVVDWATASWGPADLDVAHCSTNLALLHGPAWGQRFAEAYEEVGGVLAATTGERLYWRVRDGLARSEEVQVVAQAWRKAGRTELSTHVVEERLNSYVTALMDR